LGEEERKECCEQDLQVPVQAEAFLRGRAYRWLSMNFKKVTKMKEERRLLVATRNMSKGQWKEGDADDLTAGGEHEDDDRRTTTENKDER